MDTKTTLKQENQKELKTSIKKNEKNQETPKIKANKPVKKATKKVVKNLTKKSSKKNYNKPKSSKSEVVNEKKETRVSLINCSKSVKISLPDYSSVGVTYSVSMDLGDDDSTQERIDLRRSELSGLVEKYLSEEISKITEFYKVKRKELESEILEYSKKLSELGNIKSQYQFLSNRSSNSQLNGQLSESVEE
ncbi:MAG: hypothetical protein QXS29_10590 [Nitrososphaeria archaeon]